MITNKKLISEIMEEKENQRKVKIKVPEKSQTPLFSNMARVNASSREVIIDFSFVQPNTDEGIVATRVALTPGHAKALRDALDNTLKHYENRE